MFTYVKGDDVNKFFASAHAVMMMEGFVHLQLEPGDVTRYELTITELDKDYLISLVNLSQQTCLVYKDIDVVQPELMHWQHSINPNTRALVAEVVNSVSSGSTESLFFDWEVGRAKLPDFKMKM